MVIVGLQVDSLLAGGREKKQGSLSLSLSRLDKQQRRRRLLFYVT